MPAFRELLSAFGIDRLRSEQSAAIDAFMAGRDVLVVLPTGYGKSLCFQLPALALARSGSGCTLVVSPLIALMNDQVAALRARGVRASALHSAIPWAEQRGVLDDLAAQELVYVSPERLESARVRRSLMGVARVVIDEAHCVSEWGHDFRPEYARLGWLKEALSVPLMALTATATPRVRTHVVTSLGMRDVVRVERASLRPNLSFHVALPDGGDTRTGWACELLRARGFGARKCVGRALVYTATRKRAEAVQKALRKAGVRAGYYHAGRSESARMTAQRRFQDGTTPVLVATSAFGMGIDLPDVRLVLHVEAPGTLESYVQQAGRAGRDGARAECWLAFARGDARIHERLRGANPAPGALDGFRALEAYAFDDACRQQTIALHLDGAAGHAPCGACDVCSDAASVRAQCERARGQQLAGSAARQQRQTAAQAVRLGEREREYVVAFVDALAKPLGRRYVAMALRGSRARVLGKKRVASNPHFGVLRGVPEDAIFRALDELLAEGMLVPKGKKYPTLWVAGKPVRTRAPARAKTAPSSLEAALKRFRRSEAKRRRVKPYQVFQNRTLRELCALRPASIGALREVWGIGEERVEKYGSALLDLCKLTPSAAE
jgi:ATP-dependent DNA helicase RecQ